MENINNPGRKDENSSNEADKDQLNSRLEKDVEKILNYSAPDTALEQAQRLAYDAMDAPTRKAAVSLARKALKISPDCADAYVILAEEYAATLEEAIYYYKAGVAAGKRALGIDNPRRFKGQFWSRFETRPYMRALFGLAGCLWEIGRHDEALSDFRTLLRLNPNDNQGVRYVLVAHLLETENTEALKKLLNKYHESSAAWLYTKALILFLEQGDNPESKLSLRLAIKYNRYVIPYLTGQKHVPQRLPYFMGYGDKNEAIYYAIEYGRSWLKIKGALEWLKSVIDELPQPPSKTKVKGVPEVFLKAFSATDRKNAREKLEEIYTFRIDLKYAPGIWRKIDIKGTQSLHHLHQAIVEAFDRDDDHLYAFFMNNKAWDNTDEYGPPYGETSARNSMKARINSLGLDIKSKFLYIFDFGDDWEHPITLTGIRQEAARGKFPRIVKSKGEAPPQYRSQEQ
jgi:tetratricopeptide (TPR) repeat protein